MERVPIRVPLDAQDAPDGGPDYPTCLTLVCGSRSLADDPDATAWARYMIECITDHADAIVTGDAPGPDTWVREKCTVPCIVYALDGTVRDARGRVLGRWCAAAAVPARGDPRWRKWPLTRNQAMVRAVALRARRDGRLVAVHALYDPRSSTSGTLQTVTEARRAGLGRDVHVDRYDLARWRETQAAMVPSF